MKRQLYIILAIVMFMGYQLSAQQVTGKLSEAENAYSSGDLENARFALQQALAELDQVLGQEILAMLPSEMESLPIITEEDNVTGNALGFTGMYVNRSYRNEEKSVNIELIDDSPIIASVNTLLAMPAFMGGSDENQKRVKIHGYKSLLQKSVDDSTGVVNYEIQIPFNKSMLTFRSQGFSDENTVLKMTESIPLEAIIRMTK